MLKYPNLAFEQDIECDDDDELHAKIIQGIIFYDIIFLYVQNFYLYFDVIVTVIIHNFLFTI